MQPQVQTAEVKKGSQRLRVSVLGGAVVHVDLLPLGSHAAPLPAPKDATLKKAVKELGEYLDGKRKRFTVPFTQSATPFHQAIYKALAKVPFGRVVSYGDLAKMAGRPKAARAVGTAMNRNQLPLLVPCHRVVASNGLGGFGCGIEWKKALLALEGARLERKS